MAKKILLLPFLLLALNSFGQFTDCYKFRDGRFRIADTHAGVITIAERHGAYETQSSEALKAVVRFRISWQDNCSYTLTLDKVIRNENKLDFPSNLTITVKITETNGDSCVQETSSSMTNGVYKTEVVKLN